MTGTEPLPLVDAVRRRLEIEDQVEHVRTNLTMTTNLTPSPAQLWPLLTDRTGLARWLGPISANLVEGGRYRTEDGAHGQVLELVEPHKISLTCQKGEVADPIQVRLDPEDDGTTSLRLSHTTLIDRERFDRLGPGAAAIRWEIALLALAAAVDGWEACVGCPTPEPTSAWLESPAGAEHLQAWSVRWAAEALAAGVDEDTARRGELATSSVYRGAPAVADPAGADEGSEPA